MFWIAVARGRYGSQFDVLSMLSHFSRNLDIRWKQLKPAKRLTARIDSKHAGLALTV